MERIHNLMNFQRKENDTTSKTGEKKDELKNLKDDNTSD